MAILSGGHPSESRELPADMTHVNTPAKNITECGENHSVELERSSLIKLNKAIAENS